MLVVKTDPLAVQKQAARVEEPAKTPGLTPPGKRTGDGQQQAGLVAETARVHGLPPLSRRPGDSGQRQEESEIRNGDVEEALRQANLATEAVNVSLRFQVHDSSERMMVQVVDINTNRVIKEIPPEELLDLVGNIREMIGVLLDEKR